jgi:hypothetical protein
MGNRSWQETAALTSSRVQGEANPYGVCCGRSSGQNCYKLFKFEFILMQIFKFFWDYHTWQSSPLQVNSFDNQSLTDTPLT